MELPPTYFVRAVDLAQRVPFGAGSAYDSEGRREKGVMERHPALRELCDWWNLQGFRSGAAPARFAHLVCPWVLDGEFYRTTYGQTPPQPVSGLLGQGDGQARVGERLLLEFLQGSDSFQYQARAMRVLSVTGKPVFEVSVERADVETGAHDEALYALWALAEFPEHFSDVWNDLLAATDGEWGAWKRAIQEHLPRARQE